MQRIQKCFTQLKKQRAKAVIPYLMAGDPGPEQTVCFMHHLVAGGADIIELGMPFTDPMADGVVIQRAHVRALASGTTLQTVLEIVTAFRERDNKTPVVLMGYLNPLEVRGYEAFSGQAVSAGVDGILLVDMPLEEATALSSAFRPSGLQRIFLLAPTTSKERAALICAQAEGYLYYVSLKGVTGASAGELDSVIEGVNSICAQATTPVVVGFGIRTPQVAKVLSQYADGVVIGSLLVDKIATCQGKVEEVAEALKNTMQDFRRAVALS